jgi:hypothetical protein
LTGVSPSREVLRTSRDKTGHARLRRACPLVAAKGSRFAFQIGGAAEPRLGRVVNRF